MTSHNLHSTFPVGPSELGRNTLRRVSRRLLPFLVALYIWAWIDRTNLAIAALEMKQDLHLSASALGMKLDEIAIDLRGALVRPEYRVTPSEVLERAPVTRRAGPTPALERTSCRNVQSAR